MIPMPTPHLLFWLMLLGAWAGFSLWLGWGNRDFLERICRTNTNPYSIATMVRFVWSRSAELILVLLFAVLGFIAFDFYYQSRLNAAITQTTKPVAAQMPHVISSLSGAQLTLQMPQQFPVWHEAPAAKIVFGSPLPKTAARYAALSPAAGGIQSVPRYVDDNAKIIEQMYDAEPQNNASQTASQSALDRVKQHFEESFVAYFYLRKCNLARAEDFHILQSALMQQLSALNASSRISYEIQTAAKGTYQELYQNSRCNAAQVVPLAEQFQRYTQAILQQFGNVRTPQ